MWRCKNVGTALLAAAAEANMLGVRVLWFEVMRISSVNSATT